MGKRDRHLNIFVIQISKDSIDDHIAHFNHIINQIPDFVHRRRLLLLHLSISDLCKCCNWTLLGIARVVHRHMEVSIDLIKTHRNEWERLVLHLDRINTIIAIHKLNNSLFSITYSHIIFHLKILHTLNKTTLDISCLTRFNGGINQTYTTTHRMEEEFLWRQSRNKRTFDKSACQRSVIELVEVRQRPAIKSVRDTLAFDCLLTQTWNHLWNVQVTSLRSRQHETDESVRRVQTLRSNTSCLTRCSI